MGLEEANDLAAKGHLLEAEDIYWNEIESGNATARLFLAYAFHDAGLKSLALEHYLELRDANEWNSAATSVSEIYLDVHDYKNARDALVGLSGELIDSSFAAIESVEQKTLGYISQVPEIVENLLSEEHQLLQSISVNPTVQAQVQLAEIREYLAHYASVLASNFGSVISFESIQVGVGDFRAPESVSTALGSASRRWFESAHSTVLAFTLLNEQHPNEKDLFQKLALSSMNQIEKKYVLSGRKLSERDEDFLINNLIWGLNSLQHPAKDFYSHLLSDV